MIEFLKTWWANSTGFRHAVTAWLSIQITAPLLQVFAWAESCTHDGQCNASLLPDWHKTFIIIGGGAIAALIAGLIKHIQQQRAFPTLPQTESDTPADDIQ